MEAKESLPIEDAEIRIDSQDEDVAIGTAKSTSQQSTPLS
jgi:hypothetical protein